MQFPGKLTLLILALLFSSGVATAGDTLESILAAAAGQQRVAIDYREVRHLQLLNEPWEARGHMFVTAGDFLIEQLSPERQLIAANRTLFWLYIPDKGIRRTQMLNSPMTKNNFILFMPVVRGVRKTLEKVFDIRFSTSREAWLMELRPKQLDEAIYTRISIQGKSGRAADYMKTESADGDFTEWFFQQHGFGADSEASMNKLMAMAKGR